MSQKLKPGLMVLLGLLLLGLLLPLFRKLLKTKSPPIKTTSLNNEAGKIWNVLINYGFNPRFAAIVTAQAAFETAGFTSRVFKENNNAFGMKNPAGRATTAIMVKNDFAVFKDVEDSARDYIYYWKAAGLTQFKTVAEYVTAIKEKKYFEAPVSIYAAGVNYYFKKLFPNE